MADEEKESCKTLKLSTSTTAKNGVHGTLYMSERVALGKRKRLVYTDSYMRCDFVLESVAQIEHLRSVAKNIFVAPFVYETVLFLSINRKCRKELTMKEVMSKVQIERVQRRLQEDTDHIELSEISPRPILSEYQIPIHPT